MPMHMPAQRYDRSSWTHQYSDAIAVSAHTHLHSDTIVVNPMCIPHNDKIAFIPMCTHTTIRSLPCPHMECKLECQCVQRSRSLCTIYSQPTNCTIIIPSESKKASKQLHTWVTHSEEKNSKHICVIFVLLCSHVWKPERGFCCLEQLLTFPNFS